jgi:hypothetical protein
VRDALTIGVAALLLVFPAVTAESQPGPALSRSFSASLDRVWDVTRSALTNFGWDLDREDRGVGTILTDDEPVQFKDFGLFAEGTRHRLHVLVRSTSPTTTIVSVSRELWREERKLWIKERRRIQAVDQSVETKLLETIGLYLGVPAASTPSAPVPPSSPAPEARRTPVEAPRRVIYRITGNDTVTVEVTYRTAGGAVEKQRIRPPWELTFDARTPMALELAGVVTDGTGTTSISCEIVLDGEVQSQSSSVGRSAVAACRAGSGR